MQKNKYIAVFAFLLLSFGLWKTNSHKSKALTPEPQELASQTHSPASSTETATLAKPETAGSAKNDKTEKAALVDMSKTLFQFTRPESRLSDLVQYLESSQQQPLVAHDSNPDTGDMVIVRTRNPLPGTRYFHAQYFADENQKSFVQHMSFEFKPGASSMTEAVEAVQSAFPDLPAPKTKNAEFVQWDIPGGYILWVKKMASSDLQDDPFNAYTEADVGTVRVAMELEVHGDGTTHNR